MPYPKYKELILSNINLNNFIKKWVKGQNRNFPKEAIQWPIGSKTMFNVTYHE